MDGKQLAGANLPPMQHYGVPAPRMGGRFLSVVSELLNQTLVLLLIVIAIQLFAPDEYKPSRLLGKAAGDFDAAATTAQTAERAELERQLAEAQAEADRATKANEALFQVTAKAMETVGQLELALNEAVQKDITNAQQMKAVGANLSDLGCAAGALFPELSMLCGQGDRLREDIVNDRIRLVQNSQSQEFANLLRQVLTPEQLRALGRINP
ncbi:MAG: hypothetical protein KDC43_27455 [Saprospiraceae bacterium]|nr:hypothetical protein [Saprospiraceae bacterium]